MERATFVRYYARLSKQSLNVWIEFSRWINRASNAFTLLHSIFNFISIWQLSVSHPKFRSLFAPSISTRWWRKLEFDHFLHFKFLVFTLMIFFVEPSWSYTIFSFQVVPSLYFNNSTCPEVWKFLLCKRMMSRRCWPLAPILEPETSTFK